MTDGAGEFGGAASAGLRRSVDGGADGGNASASTAAADTANGSSGRGGAPPELTAEAPPPTSASSSASTSASSPHWTHHTLQSLLNTGGNHGGGSINNNGGRNGGGGSQRSFGSVLSDSSAEGEDGETNGDWKVGAAAPAPAPAPRAAGSSSRTTAAADLLLKRAPSLSSALSDSGIPTTATAATTPKSGPAGTALGKGGGGSGGAYNSNSSISLVDHSFRLFSLVTVGVWLTLLTIVYHVAPDDSRVALSGWERTAPSVAFAVLLVSTLSWVLPLLYRSGGLSGTGGSGSGGGSGGRGGLSGILVGGLTVQFIALVTELLMATIPTPVMYDPVTGTKVHLLRWCKWTPLAFLMTYLTDVPKGGREGWRSLRVPLLHGACQGLSTLCGLVFPFCHGVVDWTVWMIVSCLLFGVIYVRLAYKRRAFRGMDKGTTVDDIETYARGRLSLGLLWTCTVMWSVLVLAYFVYSCVPMVYAGAANEDSWFHPTGSLTMISEAALDVLLKVVYMKIIVNVHDTVFDDAARAERRLKELREMMSVVWDSSSDVIVVSVRGAKGVITTMVSPTYVSIFPKNKGEDEEDDYASDGTDEEKRNGLVFEFNPKDYSDGGRALTNAIPSSLQVHDLEFTGLPSAKSKAATEVVQTEGMSSLVELVFRAWNLSADKITGSSSPSSSFSTLPTASASAPEDVIISPRLNSADPAGRWEAKITRLRDSALVMVLRDTSERSRRFEAEKKYVSESTARMKDAEANRFTRHEVKNGLLSAIGLCDSFSDTLQNIMELQEGIEAAKAAAAKAGDESHLIIDVPDDVRIIDPSTTVCLHELDRTLNEVLHMVLADAMAREIVHDVYEPRWEYADVLGCLSSHHDLRGFQSLSLSDRFPIIVRPSPMPRMRCDLQLLSLIHRSAISNACKFGKKGGQVLTEVHFLKDDGPNLSGVLDMRVTNLPGPNHDLIREMGPVAEDLVFA